MVSFIRLTVYYCNGKIKFLKITDNFSVTCVARNYQHQFMVVKIIASGRVFLWDTLSKISTISVLFAIITVYIYSVGVGECMCVCVCVCVCVQRLVKSGTHVLPVTTYGPCRRKAVYSHHVICLHYTSKRTCPYQSGGPAVCLDIWWEPSWSDGVRLGLHVPRQTSMLHLHAN